MRHTTDGRPTKVVANVRYLFIYIVCRVCILVVGPLVPIRRNTAGQLFSHYSTRTCACTPSVPGMFFRRFRLWRRVRKNKEQQQQQTQDTRSYSYIICCLTQYRTGTHTAAVVVEGSTPPWVQKSLVHTITVIVHSRGRVRASALSQHQSPNHFTTHTLPVVYPSSSSHPCWSSME